MQRARVRQARLGHVRQYISQSKRLVIVHLVFILEQSWYEELRFRYDNWWVARCSNLSTLDQLELLFSAKTVSRRTITTATVRSARRVIITTATVRRGGTVV